MFGAFTLYYQRITIINACAAPSQSVRHFQRRSLSIAGHCITLDREFGMRYAFHPTIKAREGSSIYYLGPKSCRQRQTDQSFFLRKYTPFKKKGWESYQAYR